MPADDEEAGVLETHLGVERLTPPAFVRAHILTRLDVLSGAVRDRAMLGVLASIPALSASDRGIADALLRRRLSDGFRRTCRSVDAL